MIKVLGKNMAFFLIFLIVIDAVLGYGYYNYLEPMRVEQGQKLDAAKAEIEKRRGEVAKMKEEFVLLQSQLRNFKELEYDGFFDLQSRDKARALTDELSKKAGVKCKLQIKPGVTQSTPPADAANHFVLQSEVVCPGDSIDDVDVLTLLKFIDQDYPGLIDIKSVKLERKEILNAAMLRKIGSGDTDAFLVHSDMTFDWYTMIPKDTTLPAEKGN